jgi:hypothetical protein
MDDDEHREPDESIYGVPVHGSEIVFPNTVRDGGTAGDFLWKGLPNPSLVQRIGAWLIGSLEMGCGVAAAALAKYALQGDDPRSSFALLMLIATVFFALGAWTFRRGFRKRQKPVSN